jgi:hypothetical protein
MFSIRLPSVTRDGEVEGARENGEGSDGVTGFGWMP